MKLFPKINYVKVLPLNEMEKTLTDRQLLRGFFGGDSKEYYIYVLKRKMSVTTLLHELTHWAIEVTTKKKKDRGEKWHNMLDKYTAKWFKICKYFKLYSLESLSKWEKYQIETRKQRYANTTWKDMI